MDWSYNFLFDSINIFLNLLNIGLVLLQIGNRAIKLLDRDALIFQLLGNLIEFMERVTKLHGDSLGT